MTPGVAGDYMSAIYKPSLGSRIAMGVFVIPGTAMFLAMGFELAFHRAYPIVGAAFLLAGILIAVWLAFSLSTQVVMDGTTIVRSSIYGSTVVPIADIHRLTWGGARGVRTLIIAFGTKRFIMISSQVVTRDQLQRIHDDILDARGLAGRAPWPPYAGYADVDEMVRQKDGGAPLGSSQLMEKLRG
jgi:hypothetical protein